MGEALDKAFVRECTDRQPGEEAGMRIGICDDNAAKVEDIIRLIGEHPGTEGFQVAAYASGEDILADGGPFDLVLMDVELAGELNGLETAERLQWANSGLITIFMSGSTSYVRMMPHYNGFNFWLKTEIGEKEFHEEFEFALERYRQDHRVHVIYQAGEAIALPVGQIVYVRADDREIEYVMQGMERECYKVYGSIKEAEQALAPFGLIRCHKSYLVNVAYIQGSVSEIARVVYHHGSSRLQRQLPVSRRERKKVQEAIKRQISGRG